MLFSRDLPEVKEFTVNKREVLRYLGYKTEKRQISKRILKMLEEEMENARRLILPRGYFCVCDATPLLQEKMFSDADKVVFGVCTIGDALEKRVQKLFDQGEGARGVILDAIGSAAAEEVTNLLNKEVIKFSSKWGLRSTRRFSPGYGNWHVEGQELIFKYLKEAKERVGVSLSPSKMMTPIKSVSFAIKLGRGHMQEINKGACNSCTLYGRCPFQHQEKLCARQVSSDK